MSKDNFRSTSGCPTIRIAFLDVGQGDTIVVSSPNTRETIVIDCVNAEAVLNYLEQEKIKYLRGVIITHLHADHYIDVPALLRNYDKVAGLEPCEVLAYNFVYNQSLFNKLQLRDSDGHSAAYEISQSVATSEKTKHRRQLSFDSNLRELIAWENQNKGRATWLTAERSLPFKGELAKALTLLHPYKSDISSGDLNNTSIVLRITGQATSALLTGDLELSGWYQLINSLKDKQILQSDVLKFPHHGSWKAEEIDAFLDQIRPSVVVISVGSEGIKYGHPNPHVFAALSKRREVHLLCTQVTNQCSSTNVSSKRNSVIELLETQAAQHYSPLISKRGCPCAGTVIIELGNQVRILQPDLTFHRESIIRPHYNNHQCVL